MAAGLGFKTFNTGDVLSAADTNGYLMQGVLVFADAAARSAAITSPQEGQTSYLKDTDVIQVYSGSAWVTKSGGSSPLTTKGDLYTYSTTDARLPVGTNGHTLVADSAEATGLKWQAPAAGGFTFQTWSPSYTNLTIGNGTVTSRYGTSGKFTYFEWTLTFGSTTSISGTPEITLPTTPKNTGYDMWQGNVGYLDAGTNIYFGHLRIDPSTSKVLLWVDRANQTYLEYAGLDATTPFTWTTNDRISVSGQYEEA
jgi:hypothetical protein